MSELFDTLKNGVDLHEKGMRAGAREERARILRIIDTHFDNWDKFGEDEKAHAANVIATDVTAGKE